MHHQCFFQLEHLVKSIPHTVPHQSISLNLKRDFSIPLNSDFHLCNHALFFHLLFQFMVLCCQEIQGNGSWRVIPFSPVPPEVKYGPSQEHHLPTDFCSSISFGRNENSLLTKGFSFFSPSAEFLLPPATTTPTNPQLLPTSWLNQLSH